MAFARHGKKSTRIESGWFLFYGFAFDYWEVLYHMVPILPLKMAYARGVTIIHMNYYIRTVLYCDFL